MVRKIFNMRKSVITNEQVIHKEKFKIVVAYKMLRREIEDEN